MQAVITAKQAKQITGGRTPLVPVEYETAINALIACTTLDEAKYWSDKSDALAAWARIYRSNDAELKAKQLKLHAHRRMGQLAEELSPARRYVRGSPGSARSVLLNNGLTAMGADAALSLSRLPDDKFDRIIREGPLRSPISVARGLTEGTLYREFMISMTSFRGTCRRHAPAEIATIFHDNAEMARAFITEISDWLDELDRRLGRSHEPPDTPT